MSGAAAGATGAALTGGSTLLAIGAEIPPALAATVVASKVATAIEDSNFQDSFWMTKHELAGSVAGASAGVAAAVTSDVMIAGAGIVGALVTGTEIGSAFGSIGGPVGALAGAGLGAILGMSVAAAGELFNWF